ncbi:MAG TPA: M20/M25/M40 family metallo-hydrolase, partial [Clostridia bacterium]|nr:M20/M25/M40 family metallo-hydrolase [Clostridia bacterium]
VDIGDPARWPNDPYELTLLGDGFLHGRGVEDDKGPAVLCLYVLRALLELRIPLKRKLRLIVGTSEEGTWTDMANYAAEFGMPDFGFSPDGEFPIFNIEKGYCDMRLVFPEEGRLHEIEEAHSGESPNSVPSAASWKRRGEQRQTFAGIAVHSSVPREGDNALVKLARQTSGEGFSFGRFVTDMFPDEHASPLALDDGSDTLGGVYVGRTVASPTVLRLTEEGIILNVNIRVRCGVDRARLEAAFARRAAEYGYAYSVSEYTAPMMVDPNQPFLRRMLEVYRSFGYPGGFAVAGGSSYAAAMNNCVCFGPVFPREQSCAHMEDERISLKSLMRAGAIYASVLAELGN